MLVQHDVVMYTIYNHEENFDELKSWLAAHGEIEVVDVFDDLKNRIGFKAFMTTYQEKEFNEKFDLCSLSDLKK